MKPILIFVYGTLKRGYGNNRLLAGARFIGEAVTEPIFTMIGLGGFPGIVLGGETPIRGEVFEVTDQAMLDRLDRLEGHPSWYERTPIKVYVEGSKAAADVEAYVLPTSYRSGHTIITSGLWA